MTIEQLNRLCPDYHFTDELGRGSYGTVYAAESLDEEDERHYAVKLLTIPSSPAALKDLPYLGKSLEDQKRIVDQKVHSCLQEAEIVSSMDACPNILPVYETRTVSLEPAPMQAVLIFMEEAILLDEYLLENAVPVTEYSKVGMDLCSALSECESRQIIHRDIKPDNVFADEDGTYMLGDFGLADREYVEETGFARKGTFNYMAPEVYRRESPDSRSDIYSLGLLLYRIYNHNLLPFLEGGVFNRSAQAEDEALQKRMNGTPLPPPDMASEEMEAIILKACSFRPEDRFESAASMGTALKDPKSWYVRWKRAEAEKAAEALKAAEEKKSRRRKKRMILLTLVLAAAGLTAAGGLFLYSRYLPYRLGLESSEYVEDVPPVIVDWEHAGLEDHYIVFPDPYVEEAVRRAINRPDGDLTLRDVFHITMLRIDHYDELDQFDMTDGNSDHILQSTQVSGACDLTGLEELVNLQELTIEEGNLQDISALASLINMTSLTITSNADLSDIRPLQHMVHLNELNLSYCGVSDLSPLAGCTELTALNICGNPVGDLNALRDLNSLQELYAADCPVQDWSGLSALTDLETLHLSRTSFSDTDLLSSLTRLKELNLIETEPDDLQPLTGLKHLQLLDLQDSRVNDYSALAQMPGLTWLNLSYTTFSDTELLTAMQDLESLFLCGSNVRDLKPLLQLEQLQLLDISGLDVPHDQTLEELAARLGDGLYYEEE